MINVIMLILIDKVFFLECAGPYAELFARRPQEKWDSWGDELGKFGAAA